MMRLNKVASSIVFLLALSGTGIADTAQNGQSLPGLNATQAAEVKSLVAQTLIQNPEIVLEAIQALQSKQNEAKQTALDQAVLTHLPELMNDPISPVTGSKTAPVTVIEFYDYQCVYCHQMFPIVSNLGNNVRIIYKNFPIFGTASTYAAALSLAAYEQGDFLAFHDAMFKGGIEEGQLAVAEVNSIAEGVGVNLPSALKTMKDNRLVSGEIRANLSMGQSLGLQGTPDFIVLPTTNPTPKNITVLLGAVSSETLQAAMQKASGS